MGPFVAVHVEPSPNDPRELAALLDSCSAALRQGSCVSDTAGEGAPAAVASVRWLGEGSVHIDAHIGSSEPSLTRDLGFAHADAPLERFRSVGLAIATMVDALADQSPQGSLSAPLPAAPSPPPEPKPVATPAAPPKPAAPPPRPPAPPAARQVTKTFESVEVGGLFGTGLSGDAPRAGIYLRAAHDLASLPVFVSASGSYALLTSSGSPSVRWTDFGIGGGGRFVTGELRAEVGVRALLDYTSASAADPSTSKEDTTGSFIPGIGADARLAWPDPSALAVTLGVDGSLLLREVRITNAGREIGAVRAYNVGIVGGVRLNF